MNEEIEINRRVCGVNPAAHSSCSGNEFDTWYTFLNWMSALLVVSESVGVIYAYWVRSDIWKHVLKEFK